MPAIVPVNLRGLRAALLISAVLSSVTAETIESTIASPSGVGGDRCMGDRGCVGTARPLSFCFLDDVDFWMTAYAAREDSVTFKGARLDDGRFNPPGPPHESETEEIT